MPLDSTRSATRAASVEWHGYLRSTRLRSSIISTGSGTNSHIQAQVAHI
jgi:hypothetical protein